MHGSAGNQEHPLCHVIWQVARQRAKVKGEPMVTRCYPGLFISDTAIPNKTMTGGVDQIEMVI